MGQLSGYSPVQLMQWILQQLTCNSATVRVSDIRGVCTIYIRYLSAKLLSSKISALILLPFQVAHSCSPEECVPFSQWHYFLVQRNPVTNGPKGGSKWVMLGVRNQPPKYNILHLQLTLSCGYYHSLHEVQVFGLTVWILLFIQEFLQAGNSNSTTQRNRSAFESVQQGCYIFLPFLKLSYYMCCLTQTSCLWPPSMPLRRKPMLQWLVALWLVATSHTQPLCSDIPWPGCQFSAEITP